MAEQLVRPTIKNLRPYVPGRRAEEVAREFGLSEVVKLASNENPLGPSPLAVEAVQKALAEVRLYPDNSCQQLVAELARVLGLPGDHLIVGRGSDEIIHMAGLAFLNPGEEAIMGDPYFVLYDLTTVLMDARPVRVPLKDYRFDVQKALASITPRSKVIFVCSPNNPTGTILTSEELALLVDKLPDRVLLVLDEAYSEYADREQFPNSLEYVRQGRNVLVLRTFSKIYALAGLRVGYGMARPEIIAALQQVREPFNVSSLAQAAALASLRDPQQVERSRRLNEEGRLHLQEQFERLGLRFAPSQSNFVFVDLGVDGAAAFEALMRRGVIVRYDPAFGTPTHVRVTIGTMEQNRRFVAALEEVLRELRT